MKSCEYVTIQNPTTERLGKFAPEVYSLRERLNRFLQTGETGIENFQAITLAVERGHVIGFCAAQPSVHNDSSWRLSELFVDKDYRGNKYGEALVDRIVNESRIQGAITLTATALSSSLEIVGHILTSRGFVTNDAKNFVLRLS